MKDLFAPNRVAVLTALLGAVAAAIATLLGAVDSTPKAIVVSVVVLAIALVIVVYLLGSQKDEARKFDALRPAERNAVALDAAPIAAWAASPEGAAARAQTAAAVSTTGGADDYLELADPDDVADELAPTVIGHDGLPTRGEHANLGDGDEPLAPDPIKATR